MQPPFSHTSRHPNQGAPTKRPDLPATRAFIIDRSELVCDRLRALLTGVTVVVGQARNPVQAVAGVMHYRPDIVLVDLAVAAEDEFQLLKQIGRISPLPKAVIVLADSMEDAFRQRCLQLGAHYFLDKAHDFESVRTIISSLDEDDARHSRISPPKPIAEKGKP